MKRTIPYANGCKGWLFISTMLLYFLLGNTALHPQSYQVRTYTEEDGLANSMVYETTQDHSGRMWFATRTGISVYDGSTWKTHANTEGLVTASYSGIKCDIQGTIWAFSTFPSIVIAYYKEKEDKWQLLPNPGFYGQKSLISVFEVISIDKQTIIALGTKGSGLYLWNGDKWKNINSRDGLAGSFVNDIAVLGESIYIATNKGLSVLKGEKIDNTLNKKIDRPAAEIFKIAVENSAIWLSGEKWILRYKNGESRIRNDLPSFPAHDKNYFLLPDKRDGVFYGNLITISHYDSRDDAIRPFGMLQGLITEGATDVFIDREENIWFTSLRGVSKISSLRFANYRKKHGLLNNETTAIGENEPRQMALGHNDGLTFFNPRENRYRHIIFAGEGTAAKKHHRVLDIEGDPIGNYWVAASYRGLAKINNERVIRWYGEKEGLPGQVNSVLFDKAGNLWASSENGIFRLQGSRFVNVDIGERKRNLYVRKLFPGQGNSIFAATKSHGIYLLEKNKISNFRHPKNRDANDIYALAVDGKGHTWVGTRDGLYTIKKKTLRKFDEKNFRVDRTIYFIIEDRKNRLWFGTDNGVIRWDGTIRQDYNVQQGLAGRETNRAAGLVDHLGRVWIGTDRGLSCYREEFEKGDIPPPIIQLLSLDVRGEKFSLKDINKLSHNMNNLLFQFRAISFIDENRIRFRTKLEGFDHDWSAASSLQEGRIRYANLPPGRYRFHLKACNAEGLWSSEVSSPDIIINKPFWMQWWFFLSLLSVLGLGIISVIKYMSGKRYASLLERQVQEKTKELQKAHDELEKRIQERTVELAGANEELREQQNRLKSIFTVTPDMLVLMDQNFVYREANPAFCQFMGKKTEELIGKTDFEVFPHDKAEIYRQNDIEVLASGKLQILDREAVDTDGKKRWLQVAKTPISDHAGKPTGLLVSVRDITKRKKMEEQIKASLEEKEILLMEVHHRVKNNLQVIISLLNLQSSYVKDKQALEVFKNSQERIRAMALVHEKLYESNLAKINFQEYLENLVASLFSSYSLSPGQIRHTIEVADISLNIDTSIPLGLIINELVFNSLKHAFPGQRKGEIRIILGKSKPEAGDYHYTLVVADNGISFPKEKDFLKSDSLGMLLISSLVKQLHGAIELDRKAGTKITIHFKDLGQ
jgi:PAS domain S-box-containing protein